MDNKYDHYAIFASHAIYVVLHYNVTIHPKCCVLWLFCIPVKWADLWAKFYSN